VKTILLGLIFIAPPFLKKILLRGFCHAKIGRHAEIGWLSSVVARNIELGEFSVVRPLTIIQLKGDFKLGANSEISSFSLIYGSSSLCIGENSYIGPQAMINVEEPVQLGNGSALGPRSMVFTHGSFLPYTQGYWARRAGVTLGNQVWCAAGVFIQPGIEIGDDTFVNSMSMVTQSIPAGSVVEGNPARVVTTMERVKRKMTPARVDAALVQILNDFAEIGLRRELGIQNIETHQACLRFQWRGRMYELAVIRSNDFAIIHPHSNVRQIFLVNRPNWIPPAGATIFDLTTQQTSFRADVIHTALRLFMQRYFGVRFQDA
jgi:acetyltransferase-like isoleucine patch superfamily enzyme